MTEKHDHHDHCRCEESLGLCKRCNVVFCAKCSKEWGAECTRAHQDYWWVYPNAIPATTATRSDVTGTNTDLTLTGTCSHAAGV